MPKQPRSLSASEFNVITLPLLQQPVAAAEKSYGSAFTLFFGATFQRAITIKGHRDSLTAGTVALDVEWDWRLELGTVIQCGSSDSRPEIADGIAVLVGRSVVALNVNGAIPELEVVFTSGHVLRTMAAAGGQPAWSIRLSENLWITPHEGQVWQSDGSSTHPFTTTEAEALQEAAAAVGRWRKPDSSPSPDKTCRDCRSYVRLDGHGHLLDYGVCTQAASKHDGQVVHQHYGCVAFKAPDAP